MQKLTAALFLLFFAAAALARDAIPVYGPAHAGVEDADLLEKTVLDIGVLAINPDKPYSLRVGDGVTPGGVEVHAEGCITNFNGIKDATTNLNMHSYAITHGPWSTKGDADTFTVARGSNAWLRLVREDGQAYTRYEFAILDGFGVMDATHYQFTVANVEGDPLPVLEVSTNLLEGYTAADTNAIVTTRTDASHVSLVYEAPAGAEFIFFRMFKTEELVTGAHFYVPVVAESGITMGTNTWTEWPDVDGKIAAATAPLASTAAVAAVSGRVDAIEADYVVTGDLAPFATTGSVASVERRVDILETEDCYVEPFVKTLDASGTNSFSADSFYLQELDMSGAGEISVCWNKPNAEPFALMHCRVRIGTEDGCATVTWVTNNVSGLDATAISTNGWSWIQLESYPNSAAFTVVAQWSEETEGQE